jgi:hypothetical protein
MGLLAFIFSCVQVYQDQTYGLLLLGLDFFWYEFSWEPRFLSQTTLCYWYLYNGATKVNSVSSNKVFDSLSPLGINSEALSRSFPREDFTFSPRQRCQNVSTLYICLNDKRNDRGNLQTTLELGTSLIISERVLSCQLVFNR